MNYLSLIVNICIVISYCRKYFYPSVCVSYFLHLPQYIPKTFWKLVCNLRYITVKAPLGLHCDFVARKELLIIALNFKPFHDINMRHRRLQIDQNSVGCSWELEEHKTKWALYEFKSGGLCRKVA